MARSRDNNNNNDANDNGMNEVVRQLVQINTRLADSMERMAHNNAPTSAAGMTKAISLQRPPQLDGKDGDPVKLENWIREFEKIFLTLRCPEDIDFKIRTIELDGKRIKLQIWDTAGQERFRTITTDIRNWIRNIEQHASDNVNKILVGNKADMDESKRAVPTAKGQALADEYGIKFFETSAKTNLNVEEVFFSIGRDIKQRLAESDSKAEAPAGGIKIGAADSAGQASSAPKSACCGS
ncbi:hypothetical protein KSS87_014325 [Heliosperma pusillum]|nr:hypothetical protein KSS87_014325 [Heliosperma pusillum]